MVVGEVVVVMVVETKWREGREDRGSRRKRRDDFDRPASFSKQKKLKVSIVGV